ncbi:glycoside hydrolase [Anaerocolumna sp. MB42-C2]|uniref:glycoside hydrolase n=1 Tax=Anaerocolumna sp. MB42-C2 TaxID=3070997 RepID=UPI0027E1AA4E|nr:glycoside hydrolase [Anaerocolumna sp. MB42-C2]WMJ89346.1 glycoside hydrolase [Anaerocolumna sp. MB42-C2]
MISTRDKDKIKILRGIIEGIIIAGLLVILIRAFLDFGKYEPYDKNDNTIVTGEDNGFLGISYLAVDRSGSETMIGTKRLQEQLEALYRNGYVTITQDDIINYYNNGMALPKKAMFLMFEDGRTDTSIFAGKIMEKYNYIGTMLSYGDRLKNRDKKFLKGNDLISLKKSTFWELGTNGYRLSYINVFDRYSNYLGELSSLEYYDVKPYLDRDYNQYLMDYIRDGNFIPKESYLQMTNRIKKDYQLMEDTYTEEIGEVPKLYALMHANTGSFANNEKVSSVNETCIKDLFTMNFNREGYSLNNRKNDIYDLTRMQPQSYWYPNHLLMRIKDDAKTDIDFVEGDLKRKKDWDVIRGAAEFRQSVIALTSESESNGLLRLKDSMDYQNFKLSVILKGNKLGTQSIIMRADQELKRYLSVKLQNNHIYIDENGKRLFELDLDEFDGVKKQSIDENKQEALRTEYEVYKKNSSFGKVTNMDRQSKVIEDRAKTIEEGADEYVSPIQIQEAGSRKLTVFLKNDKISLSIDGREAVKDLALTGKSAGFVYLESAWGEYGYSQRNIADDVYDGVFENLNITNIDDSSEVLYDNQLHGLEKGKFYISNTWSSILNWFIKTL